MDIRQLVEQNKELEAENKALRQQLSEMKQDYEQLKGMIVSLQPQNNNLSPNALRSDYLDSKPISQNESAFKTVTEPLRNDYISDNAKAFK